jgi:hypothetical protein
MRLLHDGEVNGVIAYGDVATKRCVRGRKCHAQVMSHIYDASTMFYVRLIAGLMKAAVEWQIAPEADKMMGVEVLCCFVLRLLPCELRHDRTFLSFWRLLQRHDSAQLFPRSPDQ